MKRRDLLMFAAAAAASATGGLTVPARAQTGAGAGSDLNVSPRRLVFSPDMRTAAIYVFNRGATSASYSIGLVDRVMTPDGQVRPASDPQVAAEARDYVAKLPSAQPMLTYTPRRVTLQPGQSQVVRLRATRPPEMTLPEYHTHLTVTILPPEGAGETVEEAASAAAGHVVAKINTLFAISIAVIVRQGAVDVQGGLDRPSVSVRQVGGKRTAVLTVDLLRKGANSLYGDVEVREARAAKSAPPLGAIMGIAVYTEIDRRTVEIPLARIPASGTPLEIVLKDDDVKPGNVLASTTVSAP